MKNFLYKLLILTIFLNIWIPKSGIKIRGIPLTIGNVIYLLLLLFFIFYILYKRKIEFNNISKLLIISILFFVFRLLFAKINGNFRLSDIIPYLVPLSIYPCIFIVIYNCVENNIQLNKIIKIISFGCIFIALYGICQNIFGIEHVTIPGITVNLSDYLENHRWYLAKNNNVGRWIKTVSTYQNGNVLGMNLILIFPLVFETILQKYKKYILILFLIIGILTLSRSCWMGVLLYVLLRFIFNENKTKKDLILKFAIIISFITGVLIAFNYIPQVHQRLVQTSISNIITLSGRTPSAFNLIKSSRSNILAILFGPYGITKYMGGAYEMTYFTVYMLSGILGFLLLITPIILCLYSFKKYNTEIAKGCFYSVLVYIITAFVEGAFWMPPTALNLWSILAIGMVSIKIEKLEVNV